MINNFKLINGITHHNNGNNVKTLDIKYISKLFDIQICPSFNCNLKCQHCTLYNDNHKTDIDNICNTIEYLNKFASKNIVYDIFGGEPMILKPEYIEQIINSIGNNRYSISTNLTYKITEKIYNFLKNSPDGIDTSWNLTRFNESQFQLWKYNVHQLQKSNIDINIMFVLDDQQLSIDPLKFINFISELNPKSIEFFYHIGSDGSNTEKINDWLLSLYKKWNIPTVFKTIEKLKKCILNNEKYNDCSGVLTIIPNGNVHKLCAYYECEQNKNNCLICKYFSICNGGCQLLSKCSFPIKLYEYLKNKFKK